MTNEIRKKLLAQLLAEVKKTGVAVAPIVRKTLTTKQRLVIQSLRRAL